jgi:hypothetical protein
MLWRRRWMTPATRGNEQQRSAAGALAAGPGTRIVGLITRETGRRDNALRIFCESFSSNEGRRVPKHLLSGVALNEAAAVLHERALRTSEVPMSCDCADASGAAFALPALPRVPLPGFLNSPFGVEEWNSLSTASPRPTSHRQLRADGYRAPRVRDISSYEAPRLSRFSPAFGSNPRISVHVTR